MHGRKFRVAVFLPIAAVCIWGLARGSAFAVLLVPAVALIAPEIVALFGWFWRKGREHAYEMGENDAIYTYDLVNIHMRMQDDLPWFVAHEVGWALDIRDIRPVIDRFAADERGEIGRDRELCLSEKGVMRLIDSSRNPDARRFRLWFERSVMFQIKRKRG